MVAHHLDHEQAAEGQQRAGVGQLPTDAPLVARRTAHVEHLEAVHLVQARQGHGRRLATEIRHDGHHARGDTDPQRDLVARPTPRPRGGVRVQRPAHVVVRGRLQPHAQAQRLEPAACVLGRTAGDVGDLQPRGAPLAEAAGVLVVVGGRHARRRAQGAPTQAAECGEGEETDAGASMHGAPPVRGEGRGPARAVQPTPWWRSDHKPRAACAPGTPSTTHDPPRARFVRPSDGTAVRAARRVPGAAAASAPQARTVGDPDEGRPPGNTVRTPCFSERPCGRRPRCRR
jgi:hypothetical protein